MERIPRKVKKEAKKLAASFFRDCVNTKLLRVKLFRASKRRFSFREIRYLGKRTLDS